jgi:hypothetical protein
MSADANVVSLHRNPFSSTVSIKSYAQYAKGLKMLNSGAAYTGRRFITPDAT